MLAHCPLAPSFSLNSVLDLQELHNLAEIAMGAISLAANVIVLYLITYHSKFASPAYQTMLAIDASLDLILCIFALVGQPVGIQEAFVKY